MSSSNAAFEGAIASGSIYAHHAKALGSADAVQDGTGWVSADELEASANRLARLMLKAVGPGGGSVALVMSNRREFAETLLACLRSGMRLTPINYRMGPDFVRYVIDNCEADIVITERALADTIPQGSGSRLKRRLCLEAPNESWEDYRRELSAFGGEELVSPAHGKLMLYTSGTSGVPKGVYRERPRTYEKCATFEPEPQLVHLLAGPAFHSAPLWYDLILPLTRGRRVVMMSQFDARAVLRSIEEQRITHAHLAPIMFERLLALPDEERRRADVSSLRLITHGGAPTDQETKRKMIEWFGPILTEYYAATEVSAGITISSVEWLKKPGSVGRIPAESSARVLADGGSACAVREIGEVHFSVPPPGEGISYFGDPESTQAVFGGTTFTLRDYGFVDEDGYLFLCGRAADKIISGGVNISPFSIEELLRRHPMVADVCVVGAVDREWGEVLCAALVLSERCGQDDIERIEDELKALCARELASIMRPRIFCIVESLPRTESGKVLRREVRDKLIASSAVAVG